MRLKKIGNTYHAVIKTVEGKDRTITTRSTDKREAAQIASESGIKEIELAAKAGRLTNEAIGRITAGKKLTMAKAVEEWREWMGNIGKAPKTIHNNVSTVTAWIHSEGIENVAPAAVKEKHVGDWINSEDSEAKAHTRAINLSAIRSFFTFASAKGYCIGDPSRLVRVRMDLLSHEQKESAEKVPFTNMEVKRLVKHLHDKGDVFWEFAVRISNEVALRLGDICQLEWDCFTKPGRVVVWTDKRDKRVSVPISDELSELITEIPVNDPKYLFPEQRAMVIDSKRRAILSVYFKRICQRCEIEGKSFHSLRHTCITRWHSEGKSLESIGKEVGHSDTKTTRGYLHE